MAGRNYRSSYTRLTVGDGFYIGEALFPKRQDARTMTLSLGMLSRASEFATRGRTDAMTLQILSDELYALMAGGKTRGSNVRDIFRKHAPMDPTDFVNPYWRPPNLKDSIRLSNQLRHSLVGRMGGAEIDMGLQMRWYGWATIMGRGPVGPKNPDKPMRYLLANGRWVSSWGDQGATRHNSLQTGVAAEYRQRWALEAYQEAMPFIRTTTRRIAHRVMNEVILQRLTGRLDFVKRFGGDIPKDTNFDEFLFFGPQ